MDAKVNLITLQGVLIHLKGLARLPSVMEVGVSSRFSTNFSGHFTCPRCGFQTAIPLLRPGCPHRKSLSFRSLPASSEKYTCIVREEAPGDPGQ
jgi:hypothetical protein